MRNLKSHEVISGHQAACQLNERNNKLHKSDGSSLTLKIFFLLYYIYIYICYLISNDWLLFTEKETKKKTVKSFLSQITMRKIFSKFSLLWFIYKVKL